jgi:hypothetical protein
MAGGYKMFGPTYNTTPYVRLGYEGILNGAHPIASALVTEYQSDETVGNLAGKFATIVPASGADTEGISICEDSTKAIGLFREDLKDMVNASFNATFYFRGGEYYVSIARTAIASASDIVVGNEITCNGSGEIIKYTAAMKTNGTHKSLGVVTHVGGYKAGNMFENAGVEANGGVFIGFIMFI